LGIQTAAALAEPLVGIMLPARRGGSADLPARGSFVTVSDPRVQVVTIGPARREGDLVAYLHSLASETVEVEVGFPGLAVRRVALGSFLERGYQEVAMRDGRGRVTLITRPEVR
jgi:hypothetical protein